MKFLILLLSILFPTFLWAAKSQNQTQKAPLSLGLVAGAEVRAANNGEGYLQSQNLDLLSAMVGWDNKWIFFEKSEFRASSGNASLSVSSKNIFYSAWLLIEQTQNSGYFVPYFNIGIGYGTSTIETTVLGVTDTDETSPKTMLGGGLGLRLKIPHVWLSVEGRLIAIDGWDPAPTVGAVAKLGFFF